MSVIKGEGATEVHVKKNVSIIHYFPAISRSMLIVGACPLLKLVVINCREADAGTEYSRSRR